MKHWYVITPEYGTVDPVCDGQGPIEYECDVIEVEAETKRDAIALGVKLMLQPVSPVKHVRFNWCKDARNDGCSPYAGITAETFETEDAMETIEQEEEATNDPMCKGNGHHNWSLQKDTCECGELTSSTPWEVGDERTTGTPLSQDLA